MRFNYFHGYGKNLREREEEDDLTTPKTPNSTLLSIQRDAEIRLTNGPNKSKCKMCDMRLYWWMF
jgi:hypothetical protein